ncbi:GntR family transcriptional regulator [Lactobacillus panisapium]|uniref:GntR family transcriptional regulator n=1 Tax=Lactobacillus panisapium TaxID=2012495 RepID=A0ABX8W4K4_9LACO|nr:GntR family transcriptional regulator [Lactobacillus panisapium]QYN52388.1 GntR family transcriptional regulator [Lactobacillus panisapium]
MEYKERTAATQAQEYLQDLIQFKLEKPTLPAQREIADNLNVSRNAVLHALDRLKSEDQVVVKERAGVVANAKIDINMLGMESMTAELKDQSVAIKHVATQIIATPKRLQAFFGTSVKQVIKISRIRLKSGIPLTYEIVYLAAEKFADLAKVDFTNKPLYEFLQKRYQLKPAYGRENISCFLADENISEVLKIAQDTPLYCVNSFNYLESDEPLEATTQYLIGSSFKYHFIANNIYDYREEE